MLNDLFVLKQIKDGDIKAFETLFKLYYSPLCLYAASITERMEIAEEIVQEMFYVFWKEKSNLQLFLSLKSYLYGAIRNRSLQYLEHMEVKSRYEEVVKSRKNDYTGSTPLDQLEYKELLELINHLLQKLPERRSLIFRMHRFKSHSTNCRESGDSLPGCRELHFITSTVRTSKQYRRNGRHINGSRPSTLPHRRRLYSRPLHRETHSFTVRSESPIWQ